MNDARNSTLAFDTRKLSVKLVEAELKKRPDLTIAELKALLAHEGSHWRPREGVEKLIDARLLALADEAIDAAAADMGEVEAEAASDDMVAEGAPEVEAEDDDGTLATFADGAPGGDPDIEVPPPNEPDADPPGRGTKGPDLIGILGEMTAERLAEFGLCRMMGPDPDDPMAPEGYEAPADDQSAIPDIEPNTPVHVTMLSGQVHEGYYVKPQGGAMIRMRDGSDTVIFVPDHSFYVSPSEDDEDNDEDGGGD